MQNEQEIPYLHVFSETEQNKLVQQPVALPGETTTQAANYEETINALALEVAGQARMKLMMAFRFLDTALWKMPSVIGWHPLSLATDGRQLLVSPLYTLSRFEEGMNEVVRDYLHLLLHCVFRHPLDEDHINVSAWSLACDIVVEAIALDMTENRFICENDQQRREELAAIEKDLGRISPAKLYRIFADAEVNGPRAQGAGFSAARVWDLRMLFQRDCHELWANAKHRQEQGENPNDEQAIRKRNLSDRLQDTPQDSQSESQESQESQEQEGEQSSDQAQAQAAQAQAGTGGDDEREQDSNSAATGEQAGERSDEQQEQQEQQERAADEANDEEQEASREQGEQANNAHTMSIEDLQALLESEDDAAGSDAEDADDSDADADPDATDSADPDAADPDADADPAADAADPERQAAQEQALRDALQKQREEWEEIAKQIEMDVQSFSQGSGSGQELSQNLAVANRRLANYRDFLRQFATMGEDMKINDDEFDYIYYTYGLNTYGNMPLVEPLEYQESNRVREFVIALDTSGSCSGALIRNFVTRTYDILRESEGFGDKVNIHIIQCDNKIQTDLKIENAQDLEKYCREFQAYGFGGTDFRPVFDYVQELIDKGEFENLRGLIYFTDGLGTFPPVAPAYETAFVFMDDGARNITVPPWAMRVVMDEEEIYGL